MAIQASFSDPQSGVAFPKAYYKISLMRMQQETVLALSGARQKSYHAAIVLDVFAAKDKRDELVEVPNYKYGAASSPPGTPATVKISAVKRTSQIQLLVPPEDWAAIEAAEPGEATLAAAYELATKMIPGAKQV